MVKLKRLRIEKYRNVKPGTELHFRDSLNVLLGRNGTGKTTLLNLIVQLLNWDFTQLRNQLAALEYELEAPELKLRVRMRTEGRQVSDGAVAEDGKLSRDMLAAGLVEKIPRYTTTLDVEIVEPGTQAYVLRIQGAKLTLSRAGESSPFFETTPTQPVLGQFSLGSIITALDGSRAESKMLQEAVSALSLAARIAFLQRFDESLEYLTHITQRRSFWARNSRQVEGSYGVYSLGGPWVFQQHLANALNQNPRVDEIRIDSSQQESPDFLSRLVELLGFKSAQVRLQLIERTADPDVELYFGNAQFQFARRDGSIIDHLLLSYGQKRLLAFYYYLASNGDCVVADELVNGMHHEWIETCLEDLGRRQAFLTSQNPLLLDYLYFESATEVRSSFVLCRTELHEGREQLVWENMSLDEAEGFFSAYQVAIHHVGELLRLRGLW